MTTPLELAFRAASNLKHENTMNEATAPVPPAIKEIKLSPADEARFWRKVNKNGPLPDQSNPHYAGLGPCWVWTRGVNSGGYGTFCINGKDSRAHRIAWTLANGQIPHDGSYHGTCICHRCDNPSCVNPAHLFLSAISGNNRDRGIKGRGNTPKGESHGSHLHPERLARGEASGMSKLTAAKVVEIRALYAAGGTTLKTLAAQFHVAFSTISSVINRQTWGHI